MNAACVYLDRLDRPPEESILFLDRPAIPESLRSAEIAPQFCSESLRIEALRAGRRLPLIGRFLESQPFVS